jgi:hypothetical protein
MMGLIPCELEIITCYSSKYLDQMSLCLRDANPAVRIENDMNPNCHVSNI